MCTFQSVCWELVTYRKRTGAGVAGLQALIVATLAEIIGTSVDDDGALSPVSVSLPFCRGKSIHLTPTTLLGPITFTKLSLTEPLELPWASVSMLPRSPTWRFSSEGAPWLLPWGLTKTDRRKGSAPRSAWRTGREGLWAAGAYSEGRQASRRGRHRKSGRACHA